MLRKFYDMELGGYGGVAVPQEAAPELNPLYNGTATFGQALSAAKDGKMVSRAGWNGKGMFIFMRPSDVLSSEVIDKVKSLPQSVKDWFAKNGNPTGEAYGISFTAYLCMKAADGSIVNGWLASQTDMLSDDWGVVE